VSDRERGEAAVAAVPTDAVKHAFRQLEPYHGKSNSWGRRGAILAALGTLHERFDKASCDDRGVAGCVRCNVMFLCGTLERLLAASQGPTDNERGPR
jgi:hypothetical protein